MLRVVLDYDYGILGLIIYIWLDTAMLTLLDLLWTAKAHQARVSS